MLRSLLILLLIISLCPDIHADSPATPYPYVSASIGGRCFFKMIPDHKDPWGLNGSGIMYAVGGISSDKPLWGITGWYAFNTYVSHDCKYLVRMGNWPASVPSQKHLAIAFYENGNLVKSYSTVDIQKNPAKAPKSISHYEHVKDVIGFKPFTYEFTIRTVEGVDYTFNVKTGKIISERAALIRGVLD